MPQHVQLNNIDHADLRVITARGPEYGDAVMHAVTYPAEFRNVQACYPIVFQKAADGGFQPLALFGFRPGQNLFLEDGRWDASYLPLAIERLPFLIGRALIGHGGDELTMHIDLDSPRVSRSEGEPLFLPHGGTSEFLERMNSVLQALHAGLQAVPAFMEALLAHELLESFVLDIQLDHGSEHRLAGFYTIHEERLGALDGAALEALHRRGHLQPIYMALASQARFRDLIDRVNRRGADA